MRLENWPTKLSNAIEQAKDKPFKWGVFDCVTWAADAVLAITGIDYFDQYRGTYKTKKEALAIIKTEFETIENPLNELFTPIKTTMAGRGDVVLYKKAIGVCDGVYSFFATPKGLTPVKTLLTEKAWRV